MSSLWLALALLLVLEGLLPFISPASWRQMFGQILRMTDGQIRFWGLCSTVAGLVGVLLLSWQASYGARLLPGNTVSSSS